MPSARTAERWFDSGTVSLSSTLSAPEIRREHLLEAVVDDRAYGGGACHGGSPGRGRRSSYAAPRAPAPGCGDRGYSAAMDDPRRALPSVDAVLREPEVAGLLARAPRAAVVDAVRDALAGRRAAGDGGRRPGRRGRRRRCARRCGGSSTRPASSSTPTSAAPRSPPRRSTRPPRRRGYATLEWDPATGERGSRQDHLAGHLRALTGRRGGVRRPRRTPARCCSRSSRSAGGGEVIVSRGPARGDRRRLPRARGARGLAAAAWSRSAPPTAPASPTTRRAIGPETRAILRVHASNFRVVGFAEEASIDELAGLARRRGLALIDDLGSGALRPEPLLAGEPDAAASVAAGCDLVAFSGDKLVGGPQAGILVGTRRGRRARAAPPADARPAPRQAHPGRARGDPGAAPRPAPGAASASRPCAALAPARPPSGAPAPQRLAAAVGGEVVATVGRMGGGALPLAELPSFAAALDDPEPGRARARPCARATPRWPPRLRDGRVLLDVLALDDDDLGRPAGARRRAPGRDRAARPRDGRARRPRQDRPGPGPHRPRHRPPAGREVPRHLDRAGLRAPRPALADAG